ncbi:MAG: hypothetical protein JWR34_2580 [Mycobacterium sp.]|nr:hypothetical protein [Mycobacterium sp.]
MVMDQTEPIPAISPSLAPSPERLLKLAIIVGTAGVMALIVAVIVLVWTVTGVSAPVVSQQAAMPADIAVKQPIPAAPAAALVPEPAPAPAPAETLAPEAAPAAAPAAGPNSEILGNPAMAAIAPTAPAPASDVTPTVNLPTVTLPNGDLNGLNWNDLNSNLQNAAASYLWQNSGADATTGAIVGAVSGIGNNALSIVGNNAGNLVTTLILANLGYYGTPGVGGVTGSDFASKVMAAPAALSQLGVGVPSVGVPSLSTSIGIPGTPIGTQIGPPQLPQIGPPQLPSLPRPGFAIPGTPIGVGF